jgi:hypothetical protein
VQTKGLSAAVGSDERTGLNRAVAGIPGFLACGVLDVLANLERIYLRTSVGLGRVNDISQG